jgi:hypothetical protein
MTCDRFRPLLALLVGNDLDSREAAEVRQHLETCAACRGEWASLQDAIGALQVVSHKPVVPDHVSLWPKVARNLRLRPVASIEAAPGWLTLSAFAAACAAVMWLTISTPVFDFDFRDPQVAELNADGFPPVRPVSNQNSLVQLVNDAQPAIPLQMLPEGFDPQNSHVQMAPRLFGGPRSF